MKNFFKLKKYSDLVPIRYSASGKILCSIPPFLFTIVDRVNWKKQSQENPAKFTTSNLRTESVIFESAMHDVRTEHTNIYSSFLPLTLWTMVI